MTGRPPTPMSGCSTRGGMGHVGQSGSEPREASSVSGTRRLASPRRQQPSQRTGLPAALGLDPAPSTLEARAPGDNHQSESHDRAACHLPSRHDQRRPVAHGVAPAHVPIGVVARRCVGKPSELVRTRLSGQRDRGAAAHQHKAQDPPQMTKHAASIADSPLNCGALCSSARWRVRCVDPQARRAWDSARAGRHARPGSRCPRRTPGLR